MFSQLWVEWKTRKELAKQVNASKLCIRGKQTLHRIKRVHDITKKEV